jgi:stress response protein YsnF
MYESQSEAEAAKARLSQSSIDADRIRIVDKSSSGSSSEGHMQGTTHGQGFWASVKEAFMPDDDRAGYEEGIRRGHYLLCAQVEEDRADEAIQILEQTNSIDFDDRQQQWRSDGWAGFTGSGRTQTEGSARSTGGDRTVQEEHIPIVEEQLVVGKRETERGGARVRSYVREVPVHEQVQLREEHVSVERRPVDERLSSEQLKSGDLLRDREIEMTETAEEAVVAKEARVREELVVRKTAEERVENIDDTVRRTEVEVDENPTGNRATGAGDRSAFGGFEGGKTQGSGSGTPRSTDRDREAAGTGYEPGIDKSGI